MRGKTKKKTNKKTNKQNKKHTKKQQQSTNKQKNNNSRTTTDNHMKLTGSCKCEVCIPLTPQHTLLNYCAAPTC